MVSEKEVILLITNQEIQVNEEESFNIKDIKLGYPDYEGKKKQRILVTLFRFMILFTANIMTLFIISYLQRKFWIQNDLKGCIFIASLFQVIFLMTFLSLSYLLRQHHFFYLLCCRHLIYKHLVSKKYILNRIASSKATTSATHPYYYKEKGIELV
ncbi:unnamed protein product [Cunninghamella blakesleeana]